MDTGESLLDLKTLSIPGVSDWLSKYLIKFRDKNTILLYPKNGSLPTENNANVTQDLNHLPEEADLINNSVSSMSLDTEGKDMVSENSIAETIEKKKLRVLKLKKLLEKRLQFSLAKESEDDFIPSQQVK